MAISDCVIEGRLSEAEGLQNELDALNTASVCHGDAVSSFRYKNLSHKSATAFSSTNELWNSKLPLQSTE